MMLQLLLNLMFIDCSNERLDMIEKREQFLKNTFESLGGTELDYQDDKYNYPSIIFVSLCYFFSIFLPYLSNFR